MCAKVSQGGEGLQGVEGSGSDAGQLIVVQRQQADVVQAREAVVVDAADLVVPQHPLREGSIEHFSHQVGRVILHLTTINTCRACYCASLTAFAVHRGHGTSRFGPSRFDWL